ITYIDPVSKKEYVLPLAEGTVITEIAPFKKEIKLMANGKEETKVFPGVIEYSPAIDGEGVALSKFEKTLSAEDVKKREEFFKDWVNDYTEKNYVDIEGILKIAKEAYHIPEIKVKGLAEKKDGSFKLDSKAEVSFGYPSSAEKSLQQQGNLWKSFSLNLGKISFSVKTCKKEIQPLKTLSGEEKARFDAQLLRKNEIKSVKGLSSVAAIKEEYGYFWTSNGLMLRKIGYWLKNKEAVVAQMKGIVGYGIGIEITSSGLVQIKALDREEFSYQKPLMELNPEERRQLAVKVEIKDGKVLYSLMKGSFTLPLNYYVEGGSIKLVENAERMMVVASPSTSRDGVFVIASDEGVLGKELRKNSYYVEYADGKREFISPNEFNLNKDKLIAAGAIIRRFIGEDKYSEISHRGISLNILDKNGKLLKVLWGYDDLNLDKDGTPLGIPHHISLRHYAVSPANVSQFYYPVKVSTYKYVKGQEEFSYYSRRPTIREEVLLELWQDKAIYEVLKNQISYNNRTLRAVVLNSEGRVIYEVYRGTRGDEPKYVVIEYFGAGQLKGIYGSDYEGKLIQEIIKGKTNWFNFRELVSVTYGRGEDNTTGYKLVTLVSPVTGLKERDLFFWGTQVLHTREYPEGEQIEILSGSNWLYRLWANKVLNAPTAMAERFMAKLAPSLVKYTKSSPLKAYYALREKTNGHFTLASRKQALTRTFKKYATFGYSFIFTFAGLMLFVGAAIFIMRIFSRRPAININAAAKEYLTGGLKKLGVKEGDAENITTAILEKRLKGGFRNLEKIKEFLSGYNYNFSLKQIQKYFTVEEFVPYVYDEKKMSDIRAPQQDYVAITTAIPQEGFSSKEAFYKWLETFFSSLVLVPVKGRDGLAIDEVIKHSIDNLKLFTWEEFNRLALGLKREAELKAHYRNYPYLYIVEILRQRIEEILAGYYRDLHLDRLAVEEGDSPIIRYIKELLIKNSVNIGKEAKKAAISLSQEVITEFLNKRFLVDAEGELAVIKQHRRRDFIINALRTEPEGVRTPHTLRFLFYEKIWALPSAWGLGMHISDRSTLQKYLFRKTLEFMKEGRPEESLVHVGLVALFFTVIFSDQLDYKLEAYRKAAWCNGELGKKGRITKDGLNVTDLFLKQHCDDLFRYIKDPFAMLQEKSGVTPEGFLMEFKNILDPQGNEKNLMKLFRGKIIFRDLNSMPEKAAPEVQQATDAIQKISGILKGLSDEQVRKYEPWASRFVIGCTEFLKKSNLWLVSLYLMFFAEVANSAVNIYAFISGNKTLKAKWQNTSLYRICAPNAYKKDSISYKGLKTAIGKLFFT
ncbi:MAG: hypothetical protein PHY56_06070, partial [Candidatus Omnitrophica bacterium]|nr:hypothetical protein [Candidatus Omnitrophota bacterium]